MQGYNDRLVLQTHSKNSKTRSFKIIMANNWIKKATKGMRSDKPCTGSKFGGPTCPKGSKRYNLAKTFRKMSKNK